jgi:hypothetical protein
VAIDPRKHQFKIGGPYHEPVFDRYKPIGGQIAPHLVADGFYGYQTINDKLRQRRRELDIRHSSIALWPYDKPLLKLLIGPLQAQQYIAEITPLE